MTNELKLTRSWCRQLNEQLLTTKRQKKRKACVKFQFNKLPTFLIITTVQLCGNIRQRNINNERNKNSIIYVWIMTNIPFIHEM